MIQSMTGFGRGEASCDKYRITIEMKSVNHRYLDIGIRMPHKFSFYESSIRNSIKEKVARGKVDVFITFETEGDEDVKINYNSSLAAAYIEGIKKLSKEFGDELSGNGKYDAYSIAKFPDVFTLKDAEIDEEKILPVIDAALSDALLGFVDSRIKEGSKLVADINGKLEEISEITDRIEKRYPEILDEYRDRIRLKAKELIGDNQLDERTLATELVVYADKLCVDEEMVRLRTHISHMKDCLSGNESIGRKLDFLTQELNREANTILSKSTDVTIADMGIELKTLIEKIREQIQNIE